MYGEGRETLLQRYLRFGYYRLSPRSPHRSLLAFVLNPSQHPMLPHRTTGADRRGLRACGCDDWTLDGDCSRVRDRSIVPPGSS